MSDLIDNLKMWSGATIDNAHAKVQWDAVERIKALESQNAAMREAAQAVLDERNYSNGILRIQEMSLPFKLLAKVLQGVGDTTREAASASGNQ